MKFYVLFAMLAVSVASAEPKLCSDLYKLTCAPGTYKDGTGMGYNQSAMKSPEDAMKKVIAEHGMPKFRTALADPKNSEFRKAILRASGLSHHPACQGRKQLLGECLEKMTGAAAALAAGRVGQEVGGSGLKGPLAARLKAIESPSFVKIEAEIAAQFRAAIGHNAVENRIQTEILSRVKELIVKRLESSVPDPEARKRMIKKVMGVQYDGGASCGSDDDSSALAAVLVPNAFYRDGKITFCPGAAFLNDSIFSIVHTIAHEVGHGIDPCFMEYGGPDTAMFISKDWTPEAEEAYPVAGLLSCLRKKESIGAVRVPFVVRELMRGESVEPESPAEGETPAEQAHAQNQDEENKDIFDGFCVGDQINEASSDWLATEVLPEYIEKYHGGLSLEQRQIGYSNVFRGACDPNNKAEFHPIEEFDEHPWTEDRVNRILLVHPKVRQQMGCSPKLEDGLQYCAVKTSESRERTDGLHFPSEESEAVQ